MTLKAATYQTIISRYTLILVALVGLLIVVGCKKPAQPQPPVAVVNAYTVKPQTVPVYKEFVGEITAAQEVEIRAQVSGILLEVLFNDGAEVKQGQPLYRIDPRPYKATLADSQAKLAQAEANLLKTRQDVERYAPLVEANAIDKRTFDNAVAQESQASEAVKSMEAVLEQARIDVGRTTISSPITGKIGRTLLNVGGLVQQGQTLLTTISIRDPVYVYFSISERDYLELSKRFSIQEPTGIGSSKPVRLVLSDGSVYPASGRVNFSDRAISEATGTLKLRAVFTNRNGRLLPGLFGKIRFEYDELRDALVVPQRAVSEMFGNKFITVIGPGEKAESHPVKMGPRLGTGWVVAEGLKPGEKIVVDGLQKATPGTVVKATMLTYKELFPDSGKE